MKRYVFDTSALMRLYIPDGPLPTGASEAVSAAWRGEAALLAPELLLAEVGQVLRKKERASVMSSDEADSVLAAILDLPLELVEHRTHMASAMALARRHDVSVYDALFLALARHHAAELLTADEALARAAR